MRITFTPIHELMEIGQHSAKVKGEPKAIKLLRMLEMGERGTQHQLAKKLNTSHHGVRAFVCSLRKQGYPIFNQKTADSNETRYFLAKKSTRPTTVHNKIKYTLPVPSGVHKLKIGK